MENRSQEQTTSTTIPQRLGSAAINFCVTYTGLNIVEMAFGFDLPNIIDFFGATVATALVAANSLRSDDK